MTDLIDTLAGIAAGSALDKARDNRPEARTQAQASYDALFQPKDFGRFSALERFAVAAFVAPFASDMDDGLKVAAKEMKFDGLEQEPRVLLLADYEIPLPGVRSTRVDSSQADSPGKPAAGAASGFWQKLSVSLAGVLGTGAILGITFAFGGFSKSPSAAEATHAG